MCPVKTRLHRQSLILLIWSELLNSIYVGADLQPNPALWKRKCASYLGFIPIPQFLGDIFFFSLCTALAQNPASVLSLVLMYEKKSSIFGKKIDFFQEIYFLFIVIGSV